MGRVTFQNVRTRKQVTTSTFRKFRKGQVVQDKDFGGGKWKVIKVHRKKR